MENFDQYLTKDSSPEEREAAEKIKQGLSLLHIEGKVKAAAAERAALRRRRIWSRMLILAVLALTAGAVLLFWPDAPPVPAVPAPAAPIPADTLRPVPPPVQQEKYGQPSSPIAQLRPDERLPSPPYAAPEVMMRGDDTTGPADDQQTLLNQLWYTHYPLDGLLTGNAFAAADSLLRLRDFTSAYIHVQRLERQLPQNDTLRYLKAYCLMEMGQGAEAQSYLKSLQGRVPAWNAQLAWYRGLSLLQAGQKEDALAVFREIAKNGKPPDRAYAKKAVDVLKK